MLIYTLTYTRKEEEDLRHRHLKWNLHWRLLVKKQSIKFIWVVVEAALLQIEYEGMTERRLRSNTHERPEASSNIEPPSLELLRLLVKIEAKSTSSLSHSFSRFFRWKCKRIFRWSGSLLSCGSKWGSSRRKPNTAWHLLARPGLYRPSLRFRFQIYIYTLEHSGMCSGGGT